MVALPRQSRPSNHRHSLPAPAPWGPAHNAVRTAPTVLQYHQGPRLHPTFWNWRPNRLPRSLTIWRHTLHPLVLDPLGLRDPDVTTLEPFRFACLSWGPHRRGQSDPIARSPVPPPPLCLPSSWARSDPRACELERRYPPWPLPCHHECRLAQRFLARTPSWLVRDDTWVDKYSYRKKAERKNGEQQGNIIRLCMGYVYDSAKRETVIM